MIELDRSSVIVLDLDDTLYSERDFESSGIKYVWEKFASKTISIELLLESRASWVENILASKPDECSKQDVLDLYREHEPNISLYEDAKFFLDKLKHYGVTTCLVTDGRSSTQRNKLRALQISDKFEFIVISEEINSEKPNLLNFRLIMDKFPNRKYVYIGDNFCKDFIAPNELQWTTIGLLDRGHNVHPQSLSVSYNWLPQFIVKSFEGVDIY